MLWRRLMLVVCELEMLPLHALDRLGRLARGLDAQLELFHCVYEPESVPAWADRRQAADLIAARVEERRRRLERLADVLRDQSVKVETSVRWDLPTYEGIVRHAQRNKPDLLIIPGVHLNSGLRAPGYREGRLIAECPAPVLFLKTAEVYSRGCIVAALDPQPAQTAADLQETIVGAARTLASALAGSPVCLLSVVSPGQPAERGAAEIGERLRRLAERHDIPAGDVHVELGEARSLALYCREARAQVIVLGAPGAAHGDRGNPLVETLLDTLECDLLGVKARRAPAP